MKVALVYDRVNKRGGAERILLALHRLFPDAPLFTSVYNKKKAKWAKEFEVKTSFLQNLPYASSSHELYPHLMPAAFESFNFDSYDLVISVTSEAAKGIITKPNTVHISYVLTPTRYLWSGYEDYFASPYLKAFSKPVVSYLRHWDKLAAHRPDSMIAISKEVQKRIKKFYGRESELVYPAIDLKIENEKVVKGKFFLVVSRLIPYKKIDLAIRASNFLKMPLKIVGIGSNQSRLKQIAGPTVDFLGELTDKQLSYYYKNCSALIFPGLEDFGLVMIEAQAFGKPVIAFRGGGALEIVKKGVTGEFFSKQSPESLIKVLENFDYRRYNSFLSKQNAKRFTVKKFERNFKETIGKILNRL